jgi:hypothetical protein
MAGAWLRSAPAPRLRSAAAAKLEFRAMTANGENVLSPAPDDATRKRRGRPHTGPENHKQRVERLQSELKEAQAAMKQAEEKRAGIVGAAALRHARRNSEFSRQLADALRAEIKSKAERSAVGDLLAE